MGSTRVVTIDADRPETALIEEAAAVLRRGGLVAFATETVYGLGGAATDSRAVARIFAAKGRPAVNPLIIHAADADQARGMAADWPETARRLADRFWPGPLTLVLPRSPRIVGAATAGQGTVGIRVPAPRVARELIQAAGLPIAAPSANRSNRLSPTRAAHVLADLDGRIDLILDSGPTAVGLESTVVDLTDGGCVILRPGPVSARMLEDALGRRAVERRAAGRDANQGRGAIAGGEEEAVGLRSPGRLPVHYAPRTRAVRIEPNEPLDAAALPGRVAIIELGPAAEASGRIPPDRTFGPGIPRRRVHLETPDEAARRLYEVLHDCDDQALDLIVVRMPPDRPEWSAVRDRLERAAAPISGRFEFE